MVDAPQPTVTHVVVASRGSYEERRDWVAYIGATEAGARGMAREMLRKARNDGERLDAWHGRVSTAIAAAGGDQAKWYRDGGHAAFCAADPMPAVIYDIPEYAAVVAVPLGVLGKWDHNGSWLEVEPVSE